MDERLISYRVALTALVLAVVTLAVCGSLLAYSPIYLCHDEVVYALNAYSIATTLHDVKGSLLPMYFHIVGNFWATPIHIYVMALFIKMFGVSERIIRTPSSVVGALNVVLTYIVARRPFPREWLAVAAAAFLALTPAHFIHSRLATDHIYVLPFILGWMLGVVDFLDRRRLWTLFAATTLLGVCVYTYIASVILMPVYCGVTLILLYLSGERTLRPYVVCVGGFLWPLLPLVPWLLLHPTQYADQMRMYGFLDAPGAGAQEGVSRLLSPAALTGRVNAYYNVFNPSFLFFSGDASLINATRQAGVFLLAFAALLPLGVYALLVQPKSPRRSLLLLGLFLAPVAGALVAEVKVNRVLVMLPFAALIATSGLAWAAERRSWIWKLVAVVLIVAAPLQFISFYSNYVGDYRMRSSYWFESNIRGGVEEVMRRNPAGSPRRVYLSTDIQWIDWYFPLYLAKDGRQDLRDHAVYLDPKTLDLRTVPAGSTLLARIGSGASAPLSSAAWTNVRPVPEIDGTTRFSVFER